MRKNQEIQKELDELSPELAKIAFTHVYKAPEGYFEEMPISLLKNIEDAPTNEIPEDYFETLPNRILSKINTTSSVVSIQKNFFYLKIAAAAVVIGILGLGIVYFLNHQKTETPPAYVKNIESSDDFVSLSSSNLDAEINNLNEDEVISYLEENGHDVNAALVASLEDDNTEMGNYVTEVQANQQINTISLPSSPNNK